MSKTAPRVAPPSTKKLPLYKVLLHNDDVNEAVAVCKRVQEFTHLNKDESLLRVKEAHEQGISLLKVTHKELAELIVEQFTSCQITVTMERE